jgi:hypothetical protein
MRDLLLKSESVSDIRDEDLSIGGEGFNDLLDAWLLNYVKEIYNNYRAYSSFGGSRDPQISVGTVVDEAITNYAFKWAKYARYKDVSSAIRYGLDRLCRKGKLRFSLGSNPMGRGKQEVKLYEPT